MLHNRSFVEPIQVVISFCVPVLVRLVCPQASRSYYLFFTTCSWRWCMNRNWPATNPTHRSITYQERTTMAYRARPSG